MSIYTKMTSSAKSTVIMIFTALACGSLVSADDSLKKNFLSPPNSAKPHTWWYWMNGYVSAEGITNDLEAGIGGFQAFQIEFKTDPGSCHQWYGLHRSSCDEAEDLHDKPILYEGFTLARVGIDRPCATSIWNKEGAFRSLIHIAEPCF